MRLMIILFSNLDCRDQKEYVKMGSTRSTYIFNTISFYTTTSFITRLCNSIMFVQHCSAGRVENLFWITTGTQIMMCLQFQTSFGCQQINQTNVRSGDYFQTTTFSWMTGTSFQTTIYQTTSRQTIQSLMGWSVGTYSMTQAQSQHITQIGIQARTQRMSGIYICWGIGI